eukprot:3106896-Amphidinium_carterae.1
MLQLLLRSFCRCVLKTNCEESERLETLARACAHWRENLGSLRRVENFGQFCFRCRGVCGCRRRGADAGVSESAVCGCTEWSCPS